MKQLLEGLWNTARGMIGWLFECHHHNLSRVFTINHRSYQVCFECGQQVDYSLKLMRALPHGTAPREDRATWAAKAMPLQQGGVR
jgi:hypothetical protein